VRRTSTWLVAGGAVRLGPWPVRSPSGARPTPLVGCQRRLGTPGGPFRYLSECCRTLITGHPETNSRTVGSWLQTAKSAAGATREGSDHAMDRRHGHVDPVRLRTRVQPQLSLSQGHAQSLRAAGRGAVHTCWEVATVCRLLTTAADLSWRAHPQAGPASPPSSAGSSPRHGPIAASEGELTLLVPRPPDDPTCGLTPQISHRKLRTRGRNGGGGGELTSRILGR
jgi:hypothetical protein